MKRVAGLLVTLAAISGCSSPDMGGGYGGMAGGPGVGNTLAGGPPRPPVLKNAVGPWGEPVTAVPPVGPHAPGALGGVGPEVPIPNPAVAGGMPVMPAGFPGAAPGMNPMGGMPMMPPPPGVPMTPPGMPGTLAPASGVTMPGAMPPGGVIQAGGPAQPSGFPAARSQIRFVGPAGAKIGWYVPGPASRDGKPVMVPHQLDIPGRYNFIQASIYRLKLSEIPGRPGLELYPSLEVVPANQKTDAFLAHNYIPVDFTNEDFDQIAAGNYLTKVIYLPDPQYQSSVATGPEELVSTRLDPGQDPITEATKRGHILLVVRVGGIDLETANTPPLDSVGPYGTPQRIGGSQAPASGMGPMGPQLPGVASPVPAGQPGTPPIVTPPGAPKFNPPTAAPAGPMVPAAPGTLPPPPGVPTSKVDSKSRGVQQTAYTQGADGRRQPSTVNAQRDIRFPLTSIATPPITGTKTMGDGEDDDHDDEEATPETTPASRQRTQRKGLIDSWFGTSK